WAAYLFSSRTKSTPKRNGAQTVTFTSGMSSSHFFAHFTSGYRLLSRGSCSSLWVSDIKRWRSSGVEGARLDSFCARDTETADDETRMSAIKDALRILPPAPGSDDQARDSSILEPRNRCAVEAKNLETRRNGGRGGWRILLVNLARLLSELLIGIAFQFLRSSVFQGFGFLFRRQRIFFPNAESASSTARSAVRLCSSITGLTSTISKLVMRPWSAMISMARWASR